MLLNPVLLSVTAVTVLCLLRLNVLLALVVAAIIGGVTAGMTLTNTMEVFIGGMGGNAETALSFILLGVLATAISRSGATEVIASKISRLIKGNKIVLVVVLAFVAIIAEVLIPIHIAFIPILIPPLLVLMNKLKLDRRVAACALAFGLKAPYIVVPVGCGLIFHNIISDNMTMNGMEVTAKSVLEIAWIPGLAMLLGFFVSIFLYRGDREYYINDKSEENDEIVLTQESIISWKHYATLLAGIAAVVIQLTTGSMPLGALCGLAVMLISRAVKWNEIEELVNGGIKVMGMIAFVMLVASGYAAVMRATGGIEALVSATAELMSSKLMGALVMIVIGLIITMGIGTSFGTVPVIAAIYVPLCASLGFSVQSTILLIVVAAVLGDAGSPASDITLGPSSGLSADGQHDHIWDTCVPTFLCFNIPLLIFGIAGAVLLS